MVGIGVSLHLRRFGTLGAGLALLVAACVGGTDTGSSVEPTAPTDGVLDAIDPGLEAALLEVADPTGEFITTERLDTITGYGDRRAAWALADLLRFHQVGPLAQGLVEAAVDLTGVSLDPISPLAWVELTDHLLAEQVPAGDWLRAFKLELYGEFEPGWREFFGDADALVDWRQVTWGGVLPDRRGLDSTSPCFCIPALDHPRVTDADGGDWLQPQQVVFGVAVNGEARAYPRHMMEFHELVNDTLGGREIGIPYCTLCGSAQAFFVDKPGDRLVLRTSGLLRRSNKIMYDIATGSYFDTFVGEAISGPLQGMVLEQVSVVTSTWAAWKEAHPATTILAEDGGLGRSYDPDPLGGRTLGGPIFPVGEVDRRLGAAVQVLGVVVGETSWAVPVNDASAWLRDGGKILLGEAEVRMEGSGLVAYLESKQLVTHQAYWFAWSQFNPDTSLWQPGKTSDQPGG